MTKLQRAIQFEIELMGDRSNLCPGNLGEHNLQLSYLGTSCKKMLEMAIESINYKDYNSCISRLDKLQSEMCTNKVFFEFRLRIIELRFRVIKEFKFDFTT
jgi:hypothetical protein